MKTKVDDVCGEYSEGMCGIPGFHTTIDDPFYKCCKMHDKDYDIVHPGQSTKQIDQKLRLCCLAIAKTDPFLRARAELYYKAARRYGIAREWLGKIGLWQLFYALKGKGRP